MRLVAFLIMQCVGLVDQRSDSVVGWLALDESRRTFSREL